MNPHYEVSTALRKADEYARNHQDPGIRCGSHLVIQFNNHFLVRMADIKGLANQDLMKTLTNDFGSMTNAILRLSSYYVNHRFIENYEQQQSSFNRFLYQNVHRGSKILLCTVVQDSVCSEMAIDFTHKIKQYFWGQNDDCQIDDMISSTNCKRMKLQFKKLASILAEVDAMVALQKEELRKLRRRKVPCSRQQIIKMKSEQQENVNSFRQYAA